MLCLIHNSIMSDLETGHCLGKGGQCGILVSLVLICTQVYTLWKYQTYNKKLKCQFTYRYNNKNYGCLLILENIGSSYRYSA